MNWFERAHGQKNPKTRDPEELNQFEYTAIERRIQWRAECHQGKSYNREYPITWQATSNFIIQNVLSSVDPSDDTSSIPLYVPSVNP